MAQPQMHDRLVLLLSERRFDEVASACRRELLSRPDDVAYRVLLAQALLGLQRYDDVRTELLPAYRAKPDEPGLARTLGEAFLRAGQKRDALDYLSRAVRNDPGDFHARELLAQAKGEEDPAQFTVDRWFVGQKDRAPSSKPASKGTPKSLFQAEVSDEATRVHQEVKANKSIPAPSRIPAPAPATRPPPPPSKRAPTPPSFRAPSSPKSQPPPLRPASTNPSSEARSNFVDPFAAPPPPSFEDDEKTNFRMPDGGGFDDVSTAYLDKAARAKLETSLAPPKLAEPDEVELIDSLSGLKQLDTSAAQRATAPPGWDKKSEPAASKKQPEPAPAKAKKSKSLIRSLGGESIPFFERAFDYLASKVRRVGRWLRAQFKLRNLAMFASVLLIVGGILWSVRSILDYRTNQEVLGLLEVAELDGRPQNFRRAADLLDRSGIRGAYRRALRARLYAMDAGEFGVSDAVVQIERQLAASRNDAPSADRKLAEAWKEIATGHADRALTHLTEPGEQGHAAAEVLRARAVASWMSGHGEDALSAAQQALALFPGTPRHASLLARIQLSQDDAASALETIERVENAQTAPDARATRALIDLAQGEHEHALIEARAVISQLSQVAAPWEIGAAQYVVAEEAFRSGDFTRGRAAIRIAAERRSVYDERMTLDVVLLLIRAEARDQAKRIMQRLPRIAADVARRAGVVAELAIAEGDTAAAEQALAHAGEGARIEMVRARVAESKRAYEEARTHYERAARDPDLALRAYQAIGRVFLAEGKPREARAALERAVQRAPDDVDTVYLLVRVLLDLNETHAAEERVNAALTRRPGAPELAAAQALVLLKQNQFEQAFSALETACSARPTDLLLRTSLGDAARQAGRYAEAERAYDAILAEESAPPTLRAQARMGKILSEMAQGRMQGAEEQLELAIRDGAVGADVDRLRARFLCVRGAGADGVTQIRQMLERTPNDVELFGYLACVANQAEDDRNANEAIGKVLEQRANDAVALLLRAQVLMRAGDTSEASTVLTRAERAGAALGNTFLARIDASRGRIRYDNGDFAGAQTLSRSALEKDSHSSDAHWLAATLAAERGGDEIGHLRQAAGASSPPAEAIAALARRERGPAACEAARRYMQMAPRGYDRADAQDVLRRCR